MEFLLGVTHCGQYEDTVKESRYHLHPYGAAVQCGRQLSSVGKPGASTLGAGPRMNALGPRVCGNCLGLQRVQAAAVHDPIACLRPVRLPLSRW